ncbi:hypothetical protein [Sulfitobacter sabulilitoris]|uniref:Uncharacterized protein n=1 Tax=Sulfitobacter sabulilitoris TaxID=2562655 RepID=A0A5S3PGL9_9RHOB|nr:hypothetical protein [Sulfitobacter sabulilitoris]TMM52451.1 hypothetical protein FDT80_09220 [Sulfitobacter sabulilitoris]
MLELTKTKMRQGLWEGILTGAGDTQPNLSVTHQQVAVPGITLTRDAASGHWALRVPIPPEAVSDGVQTILITDADSQTRLGHLTLIAGEALGDDMRAEIDLLRAELDMLKRAFRRHCLETT